MQFMQQNKFYFIWFNIIGRLTTVMASLVAALVVALNVYLLVQTFAGR